ncbi:hypothetical protein FPV67DRAFT_869945 [Lyophyllum atratum]|nr:hypothetical protein FPV67DRAFT_869945 [Lyophyllum atratum]
MSLLFDWLLVADLLSPSTTVASDGESSPHDDKLSPPRKTETYSKLPSMRAPFRPRPVPPTPWKQRLSHLQPQSIYSPLSGGSLIPAAAGRQPSLSESPHHSFCTAASQATSAPKTPSPLSSPLPLAGPTEQQQASRSSRLTTHNDEKL